MEKEDFRMAGCYKITNLDNGKIYIGESHDILTRWNTHIRDLKSDKHNIPELQEDFNKTYSLSNFKFEILQWFDCVGKTEKEIKILTLYLEAAYYIKYKLQGYKLYNREKCNQVNKNIFENMYLDEMCDTINSNIEQVLKDDPYGVFSDLSEEVAEVAKTMFNESVNLDGILEIKNVRELKC